jgi:hypothetical protein
MCANFGGEKKWKWGLHKFPKLSYDIFFHWERFLGKRP